ATCRDLLIAEWQKHAAVFALFSYYGPQSKAGGFAGPMGGEFCGLPTRNTIQMAGAPVYEPAKRVASSRVHGKHATSYALDCRGGSANGRQTRVKRFEPTNIIAEPRLPSHIERVTC